ncbi:vacuolar membrane protein [Heliocybe sulcata]|uniref:Vacuolar membrane protein n=1 Tax=Heliocybe sulcata TaxID=5364 RepID=A0A5C3NGY7_9AGAM|nr:vacuolar membrane protein [Heliocybe sulcata]
MSKLAKRDYAIGICLLLVVVFLWTSSNFVTQDLYVDGYEKPFLVTYLNTSAFTLYLIPFSIRLLLGRDVKRRKSLEHSSGSQYTPIPHDSEPTDAVAPVLPHGEMPPLTSVETAKLAFAFCFIWFIANWTVNASLNLTSVASATILSSTSGFFTLGIGRLFRVEKLTMAKIAAVLTSFAGVILVAISDSSETLPPGSDPVDPDTITALTRAIVSKPIFGDVLALMSAIFYAFYVILLKVRIGSESRIDMQQFFGFVGLFNIVSCWPLGLILHLTGVERFELPGTQKAVAALLINMAITWSSDYIYVLAMLKTTPLVVTVGLSLTIPLAVIGDFFLNKPSKGQVIVGAVLVIASFVVVGFVDESESHTEQVGTVEEEVLLRRSTDTQT